MSGNVYTQYAFSSGTLKIASFGTSTYMYERGSIERQTKKKKKEEFSKLNSKGSQASLGASCNWQSRLGCLIDFAKQSLTFGMFILGMR